MYDNVWVGIPCLVFLVVVCCWCCYETYKRDGMWGYTYTKPVVQPPNITKAKYSITLQYDDDAIVTKNVKLFEQTLSDPTLLQEPVMSTNVDTRIVELNAAITKCCDTLIKCYPSDLCPAGYEIINVFRNKLRQDDVGALVRQCYEFLISFHAYMKVPNSLASDALQTLQTTINRYSAEPEEQSFEEQETQEAGSATLTKLRNFMIPTYELDFYTAIDIATPGSLVYSGDRHHYCSDNSYGISQNHKIFYRDSNQKYRWAQTHNWNHPVNINEVGEKAGYLVSALEYSHSRRHPVMSNVRYSQNGRHMYRHSAGGSWRWGLLTAPTATKELVDLLTTPEKMQEKPKHQYYAAINCSETTGEDIAKPGTIVTPESLAASKWMGHNNYGFAYDQYGETYKLKRRYVRHTDGRYRWIGLDNKTPWIIQDTQPIIGAPQESQSELVETITKLQQANMELNQKITDQYEEIIEYKLQNEQNQSTIARLTSDISALSRDLEASRTTVRNQMSIIEERDTELTNTRIVCRDTKFYHDNIKRELNKLLTAHKRIKGELMEARKALAGVTRDSVNHVVMAWPWPQKDKGQQLDKSPPVVTRESLKAGAALAGMISGIGELSDTPIKFVTGDIKATCKMGPISDTTAPKEEPTRDLTPQESEAECAPLVTDKDKADAAQIEAARKLRPHRRLQGAAEIRATLENMPQGDGIQIHPSVLAAVTTNKSWGHINATTKGKLTLSPAARITKLLPEGYVLLPSGIIAKPSHKRTLFVTRTHHHNVGRLWLMDDTDKADDKWYELGDKEVRTTQETIWRVAHIQLFTNALTPPEEQMLAGIFRDSGIDVLVTA